MYVVTIEAVQAPAAHLTAAAERALADDVHDLVVWIQVAAHDPRRERLENEWGPDPRVRILSETSSLVEFPAAAFHVTLPAGVAFRRGLVRRLRAVLGSAVTVAGASLRIAFGRFRCSRLGGRAAEGSRPVRLAARLAAELRLVRGPRRAWQLLKWPSRAVVWRAGRAVGSLRRRIRVSYRARCRPGRRAAG